MITYLPCTAAICPPTCLCNEHFAYALLKGVLNECQPSHSNPSRKAAETQPHAHDEHTCAGRGVPASPGLVKGDGTVLCTDLHAVNGCAAAGNQRHFKEGACDIPPGGAAVAEVSSGGDVRWQSMRSPCANSKMLGLGASLIIQSHLAISNWYLLSQVSQQNLVYLQPAPDWSDLPLIYRQRPSLVSTSAAIWPLHAGATVKQRVTPGWGPVQGLWLVRPPGCYHAAAHTAAGAAEDCPRRHSWRRRLCRALRCLSNGHQWQEARAKRSLFQRR